jgi:hypothetical protein
LGVVGDGGGSESELLGGVTFDDPAELLDEFVSVGGNVPGFERVKLVVIEFVFDRSGGIGLAAPLYETVAFRANCAAEF